MKTYKHNNLTKLSYKIYDDLYNQYSQSSVASTIFILRNPHPLLNYLIFEFDKNTYTWYRNQVDSFNTWLGTLTVEFFVEKGIKDKFNLSFHELVYLLYD